MRARAVLAALVGVVVGVDGPPRGDVVVVCVLVGVALAAFGRRWKGGRR